jgi:Flp pilus assembly secretin CpaC
MSTLCGKELLLIIILGFFCEGVVYTAGALEQEQSAEEIRVLKGQIKGLREALVSSKVEIDQLKVRLQKRDSEEAESAGNGLAKSATVKDKEYLILDVNEDLGMVILNGGRQDGVRPGVMFDVLSKDRVMTRVRVVDVRAAISGAVIQDMDRELPKVQDRAIFAARSKN